jgi:cobalt-zinc-cadmium efflux system protein
MGHHHEHAHGVSDGASKALWVNVILNFLIVGFELSFGMIASSYALLTDSLHNLEDAGGMVLSLFAHKTSQKEKNEKKTYGYKRARVIAALINSLILLMTFAFVGYKAALRLIHPETVNSQMIIWVASIALVANVIGTFLLFAHSKGDLNIKASFIHMLSDSLDSAAIIIVGILINLYHWYFLDPMITFAIIAYISFESFEIIKNSINILMEGVPENLNFAKMKEEVEKIEGVSSLHHVHVWSLDGEDKLMECHVRVCPMSTKEADKVRNEVAELLSSKFEISHLNIQIEEKPCSNEFMIINS